MKIRHTLLILTAFLGIALLVAVSIQIRAELLDYQTAQRLAASNAVREQLLLGTEALANERSQTFVALLDPGRRIGRPGSLEEARRRVDTFLGAAERELKGTAGFISSTDAGLAALARIREDIGGLRRQADTSLASDRPQRGGEFAPRWFQEATRLIGDLQSSRLTLLQQERPLEPTLRAEANLRTQAGILSESIARNQALMSRALMEPGTVEGLEFDAISRNAGRAGLAWELIDGQLGSPLSPSVTAAIAATREDYTSTFAPLQQSLLNSLLSKVPIGIDAAQWYDATDHSLRNIAHLQQELLGSSRNRLEATLRRARLSVLQWSGLLLLGIAAVIGSVLVVRRRVVQPLEALSQTMLRLADNDLSTPLPRLMRADEIGEMNDALRVFKANAIQRERAQNEKQVLHARLRETYRQLRKDLEAAAVIQGAMLPPAAAMGNVSYRGLYRPSSLIAGDTYNVLRRNDGGIGFFQVDVAGHGAAAALVSVACHHTLSQAILTRTQGMRLEEIAAQINNDWPEDLPYFTMILGEIHPRTHQASIVQAGHPSPVVIRSDGLVEMLGEGGFPIGMFPAAAYERLDFEFAPHDRLLIYSDGLVEAEDKDGEQFSEERLRRIVGENATDSTRALLDRLDVAVRTWRGSETLDDDLSVLMLERLPERIPVDAVH
ncbi:PP2C family protein-serine/threonine phosphatase [Microvirga sesbaniae]|uniref:PP2C family protein-serine/threonine phosphatase n=1 Tax=Microvirga sesbaniae TaxID=681392 RepID=UPI0021CAD608|nr:SpoIIE family protein phosphatase [Microvirga sp. HBU67692]